MCKVAAWWWCKEEGDTKMWVTSSQSTVHKYVTRDYSITTLGSREVQGRRTLYVEWTPN